MYYNNALKIDEKDEIVLYSKDITENIILWDERLSSQGAFNLCMCGPAPVAQQLYGTPKYIVC